MTQMLIQQLQANQTRQNLLSSLSRSQNLEGQLNNSMKLSSPLLESQNSVKILKQQKAEIDEKNMISYLQNKHNHSTAPSLRSKSPIVESYNFQIKTQQQKIADLQNLLDRNRALRNKMILQGRMSIHLRKLKLFKMYSDDWKQNMRNRQKQQIHDIIQNSNINRDKYSHVQITPTNKNILHTALITELQDQQDAQETIDKGVDTNQHQKYTQEQVDLINKFNQLLQIEKLDEEQLQKYKEVKKEMARCGLANLTQRLNESQQMLVESALSSPTQSQRVQRSIQAQLRQSENEQDVHQDSIVSSGRQRRYVFKQQQSLVDSSQNEQYITNSSIQYTSPQPNTLKTTNQQIREKLSQSQQLEYKEEKSCSKQAPIIIQNVQNGQQLTQHSILDKFDNANNYLRKIDNRNNNQTLSSDIIKQSYQNENRNIKQHYIYQNYQTTDKNINIDDIATDIHELNMSQHQLKKRQQEHEEKDYCEEKMICQDIQPVCISKLHLRSPQPIKAQQQHSSDVTELNLDKTESIYKKAKHEQEVLTKEDIRDIRGKNQQQKDVIELEKADDNVVVNIQKDDFYVKEHSRSKQKTSVVPDTVQLKVSENRQTKKPQMQQIQQKENEEFFRSKRSRDDFMESINSRQSKIDIETDFIDQEPFQQKITVVIEDQKQQVIRDANVQQNDNIELKRCQKSLYSQQVQQNKDFSTDFNQDDASHLLNEDEIANSDVYLFQQINSEQVDETTVQSKLGQSIDNKIIKLPKKQQKASPTVNLQKSFKIEPQSESEDDTQPEKNQNLTIKSEIQKQIIKNNQIQQQELLSSMHQPRHDIQSRTELIKQVQQEEYKQYQELIESRQRNQTLKNRLELQRQHHSQDQIEFDQLANRKTNIIVPKIKQEELETVQLKMKEVKPISPDQRTQSNTMDRQTKTVYQKNQYDKIIHKFLQVQQQIDHRNINNIQSATTLSVEQMQQLQKQSLEIEQTKSAIGNKQNIRPTQAPIRVKNEQDQKLIVENVIQQVKQSDQSAWPSQRSSQITNQDGQKMLHSSNGYDRAVKKPVITPAKQVPPLNGNIILEDQPIGNIDEAVPINACIFKTEQNDEDIEVVGIDTFYQSIPKNQQLLSKNQDQISILIASQKSVNSVRSADDEVKSMQLQMAESQRLNLKDKSQKVNLLVNDEEVKVDLEVEANVKLTKRSQVNESAVDVQQSNYIKEQVDQLRPRARPKPNIPRNDVVLEQQQQQDEMVTIPCAKRDEDLEQTQKSVLSASIRSGNQELISSLRPAPREQVPTELPQEVAGEKQPQQDLTVDSLRPGPRTVQ